MFIDSLDLFFKKIFQHKNEVVPAFILSNLYHQGKYLPYTNASLSFKLLANITNDIIINNKKSILEFGSGISTIIFARLIKLNNLETKIISIDESAEWILIVKKLLKDEGIENVVTFIHAPTIKSSQMDKSFEYDENIVSKELGDTKFDLILIDGPIAWSSKKRYSRASNIKHFINNLDASFTIFVDDTNRIGERYLVKQLKKKLNLKPNKLDATFMSFTEGMMFNYEI
ncbi:class I SAM-dependent methyltransferase [Flavobacterium sp. SM2513]|uniref:class I SAM-dependent methyltransferase n=1 Tax=Flavobacterium sp. SM2513 TaxID=3424766 RepID=UPI003D7F8F35